MTVTLEDILVRLSENKDAILSEVRDTKDKLSDRVGKVETEVATIGVRLRSQEHAVNELKHDFKACRCQRDDVSAVAALPARAQGISADEVKESFKDLKLYASLGAFITSVVLTVLNILGII